MSKRIQEMLSHFRRLSGLALTLAISGCGGEAMLPTVEIKAKVFVDDKEFGPATVSLSPPDAKSKTPNCGAMVSASGDTELNSYKGKKGIVPGRYSVQIGQDPLTMSQVPLVAPVTIEITDSTKTVEIRLKTEKNAKPGSIPVDKGVGAMATN